MFTVNNAFYDYEGQLALNDVSLEVKTGETLVIMGPNGVWLSVPFTEACVCALGLYFLTNALSEVITLKIKRLDHIVLTVSDLAKATHFYNEVFDMPIFA